MQIRMMAVQINKNTYPIAVACLGGSFARLPYPEVEGAYLIINTPDQQPGSRGVSYPKYNRPRSGEISLGNIWLPAADFVEMYKWDGRSSQEKFFEVTKVAEKAEPDPDPNERIVRAVLDQFRNEEDEEGNSFTSVRG